MGALDGIRVLDLSRVLAGPFCGQLLADNGAEVVKVEGPEGDLNHSFPRVIGKTSTNNMSVNRGKRGITLNLKNPEGKALLHRLAAKADVVIQSFLPRVAESLGADYGTLSRINPDLVHATISGYGAKGPLKDKPGYDMLVTAYSGIMALTGDPDRPAVRPGVTVVDLSTGMLCYGGIVSALLARARGQARGQQVQVSLLESAVTLLGFHAVNWLVAGIVDEREGAGYSTLAPFEGYRAKDGDILIGAATEAGWRKLCQTLGDADMAEDPRYRTNPDRCANRPSLRLDLECRLGRHDVAHWMVALDAAGVPCSPIQRLDAALQDPQVLANDMVVTASHPDGRALKLVGLPFKLSVTPGATGGMPPAIGEHTEAVLRDWLGMNAGDVARLGAAGSF